MKGMNKEMMHSFDSVTILPAVCLLQICHRTENILFNSWIIVSVYTVPCINTQQFKSLTIIGQVPESIIYYAWYKATSIGPVNWGNVF